MASKTKENRGWGNAAALRGQPASRFGGEEAINCYFMLGAHRSAEQFLQTMVTGSVFDRLPWLRIADPRPRPVRVALIAKGTQ